ncbi:diguanylate cyclase domain-containing protein [Synechococcus sp. CCY 9618]|uniref:sensor domain-containing diguanylate cyclase n=1 Tax=Synechococcus sp. CCY 9618 TaxID=2815602 RepID=UPI001C21D83D|nr:diguanylate cyclase [Synechococcus sp. CCY 9618]
MGRSCNQLKVHAIPPIVLVVGLLITALVCGNQRRLKAEEHLRTEHGIARDVGSVLHSRLVAQGALLLAVVGLFDASEVVSQEEFRRFVASLELSDEAFKGMQGLGFVAVEPGSDRIGLDAGPQARDRVDSGIRPPDQRPITTTVLYLEPLVWRNQRTIGYDLFTHPVHREAMRWSAITGEPALTATVSLVQEPEAEKGNTLYRPLFAPGPLRPSSEAARLTQLRGWAFLVLRMEPLIQAALAELDNPDLPEAAVLIYQGSQPTREALLFDNQQIHGTPLLGDPAYSRVQIANRQWLVGVQLSRGYAGASGLGGDLTLLGLLGGSISLLAALTCRYLVNNHVAITQALRESEQANQERALASAVFETSPLAILVTDPKGRIISTNNAFTDISGLSRTQAKGEKASILRSGRHGPEFYRQMWELLLRTGIWKGEIWNLHRDNQIRRDELTIIAVLDHHQTVTQYVGMLQDITDRYTEQEKVKFQAMHDYLTGLPNRALLMEQLSHQLALARRYRSKVALMFIDLDGFKPVNDQHGHGVGDQLLQLVAHRMQRVLRDSDVLCRQGGDEYVLLIPEAPALEQLVDIARKLRAAVGLPYPELPADVVVSVSIGIACWPEHGSDADSLLDAADAAMYRAKQGSPESIELATLLNDGRKD